MKEKKFKEKNKEVFLQEFNSIEEFWKYICDTPINEPFRWKQLSSVNGSEEFTKTESFEKATELLKNGCDDISKKLTEKLKVGKMDVKTMEAAKNIYDVQGFQCCVPLYLQGVPTNMIAKKNVKVKQKVITITKSISYSGYVKAEKIIEESIKALQIVKKIESQGIRCNLNISLATEKCGRMIGCKVRIKNANEKLNISKLSFCMVHPSMLRRIFFRYIEVNPNVTEDFTHGYGSPVFDLEQKKYLDKNEYFLPEIFNDDIENIKDLEAIK